MTLLTTKAKIETHLDITINVREAIIKPFIKDAQYEDIRPLLGNVLYFDLLKDTTDKYKDLLEGSEFQHDDKTYQHEGLESVLSSFAYGRFMDNGGVVITDFGIVTKTNGQSTPASSTQLSKIKLTADRSAFSKFELVKLYMQESGFIDCEYQKPKRSRIRKVGG